MECNFAISGGGTYPFERPLASIASGNLWGAAVAMTPLLTPSVGG